MTHPHRWLRAAHKIAPNGALLPDISYYRLDRTERSRPFPTNPPEVRNHPVRFIDSLPAEAKCFSGFSVSFFSPLPCPSAKRPQSRCDKLPSLVRHLSCLPCSVPHRRSLPSCDTAGISAYTFGFSHRGLPLRSPRLLASQKRSGCACGSLFTLGQASRTKALSCLLARSRSPLPCR